VQTLRLVHQARKPSTVDRRATMGNARVDRLLVRRNKHHAGSTASYPHLDLGNRRKKSNGDAWAKLRQSSIPYRRAVMLVQHCLLPTTLPTIIRFSPCSMLPGAACRAVSRQSNNDQTDVAALLSSGDAVLLLLVLLLLLPGSLVPGGLFDLVQLLHLHLVKLICCILRFFLFPLCVPVA
jgi:hypothetical protein